MKYRPQLLFKGADAVIGALPSNKKEKVTAEFEAIRRSPGVLDGNQLQAANAAVTVRVSGGQAVVTDGPAVEARTELNGYYIYHPPDLDAAIPFAAPIPLAPMGRPLPVRPMLPPPARHTSPPP